MLKEYKPHLQTVAINQDGVLETGVLRMIDGRTPKVSVKLQGDRDTIAAWYRNGEIFIDLRLRVVEQDIAAAVFFLENFAG